MSELDGPELALAVARAMGKEVRLKNETVHLWEVVMDHNGDEYPMATEEFRPDLGGADAWKVLEWVRGRIPHSLVIFSSCDRVPILCRVWYPDDEIEVGGSGPTDAIALCRAVVALGVE